MLNKIKLTISKNLLNLPGWRTNRKIVVIESDDWGSIRMPSKMVFDKLLNAGIRVDKCHYCSNDSLESGEDLSLLFDVLSSVKDKFNRPALITANTLVANPDFEKIESSGFTEYHYKKITEGFLDVKGSENLLTLYKEGEDNKLFKVQSHGREHLNVSRWMEYLINNDKETRIAFDYGVYGLSTTIASETRSSFLPAFDFETIAEELQVNDIAKDGLEIFRSIFGHSSSSFIAPNYVWGKSLEKTIHAEGVNFIQGGQTHRYTKEGGVKSSKRLRYTGKQNQEGQIDLARNAHFEPSEDLKKDWVNSCLSNINLAFTYKHPAIISTHRVNFVSGINKNNRDANLKILRELLVKIKNRWPDVEFMSSDDLGELVKGK